MIVVTIRITTVVIIVVASSLSKRISKNIILKKNKGNYKISNLLAREFSREGDDDDDMNKE